MSARRKLRLALVVYLAATACSLNPATRRPEIVLVSRAKERELGEQEARRVAETMGLIDDPALTAYVSAAERMGSRETRLRVVAARDGETLARLLDRAGATAWDAEMAAVANGIEASAPLHRGQLVKVVRAEPYRPR